MQGNIDADRFGGTDVPHLSFESNVLFKLTFAPISEAKHLDLRRVFYKVPSHPSCH